ncbi:MAG TPA: bifunctional glutamate N-acetyltransferase/amino-acid acetyltransferase ArgJ [Polyangiaceae bacterium]|nr:bifunctional glutamate N-acetyltransferase/amino-acid acetyltransferase ArgJ [Polyangiaceae bacterium]
MTFPHPLPTLEALPFNLGSLAGVRAAGVAAGIKASGKPDVALLVSDRPLSVAGVFTQNRYAAAPVLLSRAHLAKSGGKARAFLVTSGNANACTGARGDEDARLLVGEVARRVGCDPTEVLIAQTGVIGVELPRERALAGVGAAFDALAHGDAAGRAFVEAIRTTDAFEKQAAASVALGEVAAKVAGCCKGAGMIEPNMATLLAFLGTDVALDSAALGRLVARVASQSFNALHVDTHTSTNDSFFVFSTGETPAPADLGPVEDALTKVAARLAWLIARDGEGATKVATIRVAGATSDAAADAIARRIATSALVRTALFGNDPNWGRIVSAVGNGPEVVDPREVRCDLQGVTVFERGEPARFDKAALSAAMKAEDVAIRLDVGSGSGSAVLMTSDLGYRYVEVNAEYTT